MQGNPRKTKEKSLDFLGFLWSNRDFSMGYDESKQKNRRTLKLASRIVLLLKILDVLTLLASPAVVRTIFRQREDTITYFYLFKGNAGSWRVSWSSWDCPERLPSWPACPGHPRNAVSDIAAISSKAYRSRLQPCGALRWRRTTWVARTSSAMTPSFVPQFQSAFPRPTANPIRAQCRNAGRRSALEMRPGRTPRSASRG